MRKVTMPLSAAAIASMAYRAAAAVKGIPALVFLVAFASGAMHMDAGDPGVAGYECCVAWDAGEGVPEHTLEPPAAGAEETWIPEEYQGYCREAGEKYGICPELLMAMIERESSGDAWARNSAGDTGLLQVNPRWHGERMERLGVTDLHDPWGNILVAADYLAELFGRDGDPYLVLMEYNMGRGTAVRLWRQGKYSEYAVSVSQRAWELERLHERGAQDGKANY